MPSRFDPERGALLLSPTCLAALPALLQGDISALDSDTAAELVEGHVVVDGLLDPRLRPVAACLGSPSIRLSLDTTGRGSLHVDGWVDHRVAVLARSRLPAGTEAADVAALPRRMLAFQLARLLELGPRRPVKVRDPVEIDEGLLEALLVPGEGLSAAQVQSLLSEVDEVIPEWLSVLAQLSHAPSARWRAGAWWNSAHESPKARMLEVVEGDAGSFMITRGRRPDRPYRRATLRPLTSTMIWRLVCALAPRPQDVMGPLGR